MRPYAFAEIDRTRDELEKKGVDVIDFGVGDPTSSTPEIVRTSCKEALDRRAESGYPSYQGSDEFRAAVSSWFQKRFGVQLDPASEITTTIGSKQAIFMLPLAYVDPGDVVLIPDPGYPPYTSGTRARQAECHYLPLEEEADFFPDLSSIPSSTSSRAKILWVNYPNNPTTKIATKEFMKEAVDYCTDNEVLLVSDEAYSELYYDEKPSTVLGIEAARDVCLVFNSLSKRSSMTGYRIGFVAGRPELLDPFKKVQTQAHSGAATFIQDAAAAGLSEEGHVEDLRKEYREKRDTLVASLKAIGLESIYAEGTFYVWTRAPEGYDSLGFSKRLLSDAHVNTVPGKALSQATNAGDDFLRFALVPSLVRTTEACARIERIQL
jgi:LL-diaminopimelate aminotransferase